MFWKNFFVLAHLVLIVLFIVHEINQKHALLYRVIYTRSPWLCHTFWTTCKMDSWCWWSFVQINHYLYITNQNFKNIIIFFFLILPLTFSQVKICWNEHNTLHSKMRIWHLGVLRRKKFISIALVVLKIFKRVKSATFSLTRCKPDVNKIKGKNGRLYAINVCGWPWPS